uniref:Lysosomal-trafficking regulator n=1 Tax=Timema cristinae TaxID=61476 RepID=A0A7R9GY35_TIMCR|nr:unnamed protein product [Timema cristinae]
MWGLLFPKLLTVPLSDKSLWLDIFLAEFLTEVKDGKTAEEVLSFCVVSSVATLIGCELLSDVRQICSKPGDGEDLSLVLQHCLRGRGWRCLATLQCLGVENISCGRELAELLIFLYPVCLDKTERVKRVVGNPYLPLKESYNIEDIFRTRVPLKHKFRIGSSQSSSLCPPTRGEFLRTLSNTSSSRLRRYRTQSSSEGAKVLATSDSEHQGEDCDIGQTRSNTLKIWLDPMDFDYFTSIVRSDDESRLDSLNYTPCKNMRKLREVKRMPDEFKNENILEVMKSEIGPYEFMQLVISILQNLCHSDLSISTDNSCQVSVQAIKFAQKNLCSLQFGSAPKKTLTFTEVAELKSAMTQLFLTALEKILLHPELTTTVINNGILPVMLKILEDAISKISSSIKVNEDGESIDGDETLSPGSNSGRNTAKPISSSEAYKIQEFIFGTTYGVIMFLYCLLLQKSNANKFSDFLEIFQLFPESHGGRLVEKTIVVILAIPFVETKVSVARAKKVIDLVGQLIAALKKVRSDIIHSHQCHKIKHKNCERSVIMGPHHHQDLFGNVFSSSVVISSSHQSCCIASLFMVLVRLLQNRTRAVETRVLKVMTMCGTCCCFPMQNLISTLVNVLKRSGSKCRVLTFNLLERTIYSELGAFITPRNKLSCVICGKNSSANAAVVKYLESSEYSVSDSLYEKAMKRNSNDRTSKTSSERLVEFGGSRSIWSCMELYKELVQSSNLKLCHAVVSHLLKVFSPRCTPPVKWEIIFNVFYPTFLSVKCEYLSTKSDLSKFTVLSCLSLFTSALGTVSFAEHFISLGGLRHISQLILLPPFSKLCCCILEITSVIEISKLDHESGCETVSDSSMKVGSLPSVFMLHQAMKLSSRKLLDVLETGTLTEEEVDVNRNTAEFKYEGVSTLPKNECSADKMMAFSNTETDTECFSSDELSSSSCTNLIGVKDEIADTSSVSQSPGGTKQHFLDLLLNVSVFWRACSNLAVYNPRYRAHVLRESLWEDARNLLMVTLGRIVSRDLLTVSSDEHMTRNTESYLYMKLSESTLTLLLTVPSDTGQAGGAVDNIKSVLSSLRRVLLDNCMGHKTSLRQLCDVLIRCAVAECSHEQVMPPYRKPKLPTLLAAATWDESLSDDEDECETGGDSSSLEDMYITADEGYEADIELLDCRTDRTALSPESTSVTSQTGWEEYSRQHNVIHPGLCVIAIDLMVHMSHTYLHTSTSSPEHSDGAAHFSAVVHCVQRLVLLCRDNPTNCIVLAKNGVIAKLLRGFSQCLSINNSKLTDVQKMILELVSLLARHSITAQELTLYLGFFKASDPPLEILLNPLINLVINSKPQPNYILCFPIEGSTESRVPISSESTTSEQLASNLAKSLHHQHCSAGVSSSWSNCAMALPIDSDLGWSMWLNGFSLSLWLRLDRSMGGSADLSSGDSQLSDSCNFSDWGIISDNWAKEAAQSSNSTAKSGVNLSQIHLFSLGYESLVLEVWADTTAGWMVSQGVNTEQTCYQLSQGSKFDENNREGLFCADTLTFRLAHTETDSSEVMSEMSVESVLTIGQWHHLAVNVKDYMQKRKNIIEVCLIVDGCRDVKVLLMYNGLLLRKNRATCLLLGQSVFPGQPRPAGSWYLGNCMLFRAPVFTRERAVYLVGLGPNYVNLTDCDVDKQSPNFTSVFGAKTLSCGIDWELILEGKKGNLKELQDNLLLTYCAQNPNVVNIYPQVVTNPNSIIAQGMVNSLFPGTPGFRVVTLEQRASQQLPLPLPPVQLVPINSHQYQGLVAAATVLGGTPVFLFLLARVVELRACEEDQARVLYLVLKLIQADSELFSQFVNQGCHKLLLKVLSSSRCTPGLHVLKAVLDSCCDKPVLQFHPGQRQFQVCQQSDAIIVNSFLLWTAVGAWRDWSRGGEGVDKEGSVLGTLLKALHVLLRDEHSHREFNATQLNRVRMVEALLLFCKEQFFYEESPLLPSSVCCSLVELIRSLMGAPPEFCHVVAVTDFLVLLHRASATYVTHARQSFYFLLAPSSSTGATTLPHSKTRAGPVEMSEPELKSKPTNKLDGNNFAQPVDPQKLNKALTNLQIKQNSLDSQDSKVARAMSLPVDSNRASDVLDSGIAGSYLESSVCEENTRRKSHTGATVRGSDESCGSITLFPSHNCPGLRDTSTVVKDEDKTSTRADNILNNLEKFTTETEQKADESPSEATNEGEKWTTNSSQCLVVEGLLLLLRDTLLVLPDNMAHQVLNHVVRAEALLVMANHADNRVRTAVVKTSLELLGLWCPSLGGRGVLLETLPKKSPPALPALAPFYLPRGNSRITGAKGLNLGRGILPQVLCAYLQRSTDEEVNKFLKLKGFHQLANQLALYPACVELVEACVTLVTRCHAPLEDQLEVSSLSDLSFLQLHSFPPLLALLPRAVRDVGLCHNMVLFLREVPQALRSLLDNGLLEVLSRSLVLLAHLPQEFTDLCGITEQDVLVEDFHSFYVTIAGLALHSAGAQHMQIINDMLLQLSYVERHERLTCGHDARCVLVSRDAQCKVLESILDLLLDKIPMAGFKMRPNTSFLRTVLSPSYEEHPTNDVDSLYLSHKGQSFSSSNSNSVSSFNSSQGSHKLPASKEVPRGEVIDRFKTVLGKAVDFLINSDPVDGKCPAMSPQEVNFTRWLLSTLLHSVGFISEKKGPVWAVRDALRMQCGQLLLWLVSPLQSVRCRMLVVHALSNEPRTRDLLSSILRSSVQLEQMSMFVWELSHNSDNTLTGSELRTCLDLQEQLHEWGLSTPDNSSPDLCHQEVRLLLGEMEKHRTLWHKHTDAAMHRSVYKLEVLMKTVAECAMSITRTVVEAQNSERKVFMEHIKATYSENVHIRVKWQKIIQQLTHERAVWFFPESYPRSWQLDATEGPARVRNRLQRCHLNIGRKYLMPEAQQKLDSLLTSPPLSFLFEQDKLSSTSSVLIERLHTNEKIQHMCTARVVTPANEVPGELLIGESCLYFVADDSVQDTDLNQVTAGSLDVSSTAWPFENVKEVHNRRFQLQERALEIFLLNGKTYLVAFESSKERDVFVWQLSQCHWPNRVTGDNLSDAVQLWREGLITTWEYLTQLNKMAGRSFNDLMQYPVFPFVLADYTTPVLNLTASYSFRNFKKPMAVQDKSKEQHYINNYNYLKQALADGINIMTLNQEPYHYGSHYSNSGTVLHFLVRLPPFTRMFLTYQDENFDLPDRTFHSLQTTWRLTSRDSTTDVKELVPEFYYLPEFLVNSEDFNFGICQNGERVHNVQLPPWCNNNPRVFVLVHRQALESDYVRENFPHWIDLVFGYKQTGKAAVEAINVFHPALGSYQEVFKHVLLLPHLNNRNKGSDKLFFSFSKTYYGFDMESITDPLDRTAWETMVRTYGQTPRQLFRAAHPMVVQSLSSRTSTLSVPEVIEGVKGLTWGSYVGSPAEPYPSVVWKQHHKTPVSSLVPLLTNDVFGLAPNTSILLSYSKERGVSIMNTTSVLGAALVTWGHSDGVVRVKLKKEQPPWPIIKATGLDPICLCASAPDCNQLWVAHWSGKILVYQFQFNPTRGQLEFRSEPTALLGHAGPVLGLYVCHSFSVAVSAGTDGAAIIWDINSLTYVRSLPDTGSSVRLVAVSETLGDIATVLSDPGRETGSILRLHTINTLPVGEVTSKETITALCFSSAPEGVSVNVIAAGLDTGAIRLYSTWNLVVVREIASSILHQPIISVTYSHDSQHLYAATVDGLVVIWEGTGAKGVSKTPKFLNLTSRIEQAHSVATK